MPVAMVNGVRINYKVEGRGEPLIMIAGFSASRSTWASQIPFFKKHYQVITFDNRGAGKSDKPEGPYTTRMMADDVIKLMDHLKITRTHIMGISMGGMIAQEVGINYPQRIQKLVLACTFSCKDQTSGDSADQAKLLGLSAQKMAAGMARLAVNKPFNQFLLGMLAAIGATFTSTSTRRGLKAQREACNNHNTLARLNLIKAPTLVIVGTHDRIIKPVSSEVIAGKIPGARLVEVKGGSHMLSMEMKDCFNREVLGFLLS
ncbi:MAG: alpha/beta fold hydrolase [Dehalococcoidales bacterium]|nr:alpha/beta fold hydrolase [Dehalococcoidales bacterium]